MRWGADDPSSRQNVADASDGPDDLSVKMSPPGVLRLLQLIGLWALCSVGSLALLIGIEVAAGRLILAAKLKEIGVWGLYVGIPLQQIAQTMLAPATASRVRGLPGWLDVAFAALISATCGAASLALIRWLYRAARRRHDALRPVPGRDALR